MKIIRWSQLQEKLGGPSAPSKVTIWRWEKSGNFPQRIALGPNSKGWIEEEVDECLRQRAAAR